MRKIISDNRIAIYFLTAYIAAIVVFASLYRIFCPGGFYAPYTPHESAWKDDTNRIEPIIANLFKEWSLHDKNGYDFPDDMPVRDAKVFHIEDLTVVDGGTRLAFDLNYFRKFPSWDYSHSRPYADPDHVDFRLERVSLTASVDSEKIMSYNDELEAEKKDILPLCGGGGNKYLSVTVTRDNGSKKWGEGDTARHVCLTDEQAKLIEDYIQEYNGLSINIGSSFPRMLYFSIVVITTLGLGDIVPLSDQARVLVGIEAVTGIILIGAFLNSIALKR